MQIETSEPARETDTMKTMTCKQLGGACDVTFQAETFEEMVSLSKAHGMEMFQKQDQEHLAVMAQMQAMMQKEGAMETWFAAKRAEFEAWPDD